MNNIKYIFTTRLLISFLLSGCNLVEGIVSGNQLGSLTNLESSEFAATDFPKESCGDSLPDDPQAYPLELYTVFIDDDEEKRQLIEEKYCQQVLSFLAPDFGIQLGTFIGREKAEQFKEIISKDFDNVQITGPEIITGEFVGESFLIDNSETPNKFDSTEEITKAALLSEAQMQELLVIDRSEASLGDSYKYTIKIVVPTYIPQGFELTQLDIRTQVPEHGSDYTMWYKNPVNNQCFSFRGGFVMPIGGGAGLSAVVNANSRALGSVPIIFASSEQMSNQVSYIRFYHEQFIGRTSDNEVFGDFQFSSPSYGFDEEPCEPMSFVEAVKFAESFEFLQP